VDAVKEVHRLLRNGLTEVVDADLRGYFDTIPHGDLLRCVARRIVDRHVLHLVKMWLRAPVEERDGQGKRRMSGGAGSRSGTPQGGVDTPPTIVQNAGLSSS
jgi:RNA-directed DNA polymerase